MSKGDRKSVPLQQTLNRNVGAPQKKSPGFMEPRQFPLPLAQGVCYRATPVPVTDLGFVPVTCPCNAQSVPVTSNPPAKGAVYCESKAFDSGMRIFWGDGDTSKGNREQQQPNRTYPTIYLQGEGNKDVVAVLSPPP